MLHIEYSNSLKRQPCTCSGNRSPRLLLLSPAADDSRRLATRAHVCCIFFAKKEWYTQGNATAWPDVDLAAFLVEQRCTQGNVTASLHVVLGASSPGEEGDPAAEEGRDSQATPPRGPSALLLRAAQASPAFAALTALPPGVHVLCYLPPSEAADRLTWVESCLHLLEGAAGRPEFMATLPAPLLYLPARRGKGWALVPCAPSNNLICVLARGSWKGDGGRVAWFHSTEAGEPALADDLLLTS